MKFEQMEFDFMRVPVQFQAEPAWKATRVAFVECWGGTNELLSAEVGSYAEATQFIRDHMREFSRHANDCCWTVTDSRADRYLNVDFGSHNIFGKIYYA